MHFACENNDLNLCGFLLENGADFLCEDNYRQSPFILAAKRNNLDLIKLFSSLINSDHNLKQVYRACYYASCSGHLEIVKYLFEKFNIKSECLLDEKSNDLIEKYLSELNVLHVCCYKAYFDMVEYLLDNSTNREEFINRPINEFRESTCLEEAFKGLLALDYSKKYEINTTSTKLPNRFKNAERDFKKAQYEAIINLLIENNGKFSKDFVPLNGLSKILMQVFSGPNKDLDFVHFLDCCKFLFVYKLNEIFLVDDTCLNLNSFDLIESIEQINKERLLILTNNNLKFLNESICKLKSEIELDLEKAVDEFLFKVYLISMRVLKDYKQLCLSKYFEIIVSLHMSGQLNIKISKFIYLKERNSEIYDQLEQLLKKPMSLRTLSLISIRNSIKCFGINKINKLNIPNALKHELFWNQTSKPFKNYLSHFYL